jgi:hypothetical protein
MTADSVNSIIEEVYNSLPTELRAGWGEPADPRHRQAFDTWLNSESEPASDQVPGITNLAASIHRLRPELRLKFPALVGAHRAAYLLWFTRHVAPHCNLAPARLAAIHAGFNRWAVLLDPARSEPGELPLTRLASFIYDTRADQQLDFPVLHGNARVSYVRWFMAHALTEYTFDDCCMDAVIDTYRAWAKAESARDPYFGRGVPIVTNLGAYMHSTRLDLQQLFPDPYGVHRVDFAEWFIHTVRSEERFGREMTIPVLISWAKGRERPP